MNDQSIPGEGVRSDTKYHDRTYFYERLGVDPSLPLDQRFFAIKGEEEARQILERKDFRLKFRFIGWSDGRTYDRVIRESKMAKLSKEEKAKLAAEFGEFSDLDRSETLRAKMHEAFAAELEAARANPDKTSPRRIPVKNINGEPVMSGMVVEAVKMMGQNA